MHVVINIPTWTLQDSRTIPRNHLITEVSEGISTHKNEDIVRCRPRPKLIQAGRLSIADPQIPNQLAAIPI